MQNQLCVLPACGIILTLRCSFPFQAHTRNSLNRSLAGPFVSGQVLLGQRFKHIFMLGTRFEQVRHVTFLCGQAPARMWLPGPNQTLMTSGLTLPLQSSRRLEWADSPDAGPDRWTLLSPMGTDQVEETDEAPGWFMFDFHAFCEEVSEHMTCTFDGWHDREHGVATYLGEVYDDAFGDYPVGLFCAREVPGHLVFKCALAVNDDMQSFGATFTTLAGREVPRVSQKLLPPLLRMRDLISMATDAARTDGLLQSQNQQVSVVLDCHPAPLCAQTVLWSKQRPWVGLLQHG